MLYRGRDHVDGIARQIRTNVLKKSNGQISGLEKFGKTFNYSLTRGGKDDKVSR